MHAESFSLLGLQTRARACVLGPCYVVLSASCICAASASPLCTLRCACATLRRMAKADAKLAQDDDGAVWFPIAELKPWAENPRDNAANVARVAKSIAKFGFAAPVVARRENCEIIAGHTRVLAAESLGMTRVPVRFMQLSERDAHTLALADNRLNELAPWDTGALLEQLNALGVEDTELAGWSGADLDKMASDLLAGEGPPGDIDEDEVPEPPKVPVTKPGDVWKLGAHRLVCGDCMDGSSVARIIAESPDLVFTDPPYNCADQMSEGFYSGSNSPAMKKLSTSTWDQGFDMDRFVKTLDRWRPQNGSVYVCTSHMLAPTVWAWMAAAKSTVHGYIVWCKPNPMPSLAKRHPTWATELICYCTFGKHVFNFPDEGHCLNWWEFTKNSANEFHPTQKPVSIPGNAITLSSARGATVLDFFGGSGTTLIACETLERACRMVELSPAYCDVIVERWQNLTGGKATRENG